MSGGTHGIDLREGGRWSLAQRAKNDLLWVLASIAIATLGRLPGRTLRAFGTALGVLAHAVIPSARRVARTNVARAFPELDDAACRALVARSYRTLGGYLGDAVAMLDARRPSVTLPFAPGARETLDAAIAERRGVLFASAHLGPWERVAATLVALEIPFTAVAREAYDPRLTRLYDRLRRERGLATIYRGAPGAAAGLLRTLRRGHVLGIPMDLASRVPSVEVPFLGRPARTPVGPARLALRTGAAVVVGVPAPAEHQLELAVTRIPVDDLEATAEGERILTERINEVLSARIRALPEAWVWMHPRWETTTV
ncbi:MAG: Lipid biosynthesis lauroyl acyltransferase [Labilithrix sp.]|nr:Lipid biosynthesis lauroyl acyltransferase [Labilithrix sp.]